MSTATRLRAIVYCEGAFGTPNGKTAHGLVRHTTRYEIAAVVDSRHAGRDAAELLDARPGGVPVVASIDEALATGPAERPVTHVVVGLAPDGGRLPPGARADIARALEAGISVDSGLHDFLSDDPNLVAIAERTGAEIRDVRKPPPRDRLHFFSGKIEDVTSFRIAVLGTDSAVGKRTTAVRIVQDLNAAGTRTELIGTGQTAWMQGVRFGIILDSLVNDFVSGEIEHAVWSAWKEASPEVIVMEGQGSLMNPAYPGGFELMAAGRPHAVVLQHAPARTHYDGFPGHRIHPLERQIQVIELLSDRPVVAVSVNHERLTAEEARAACARITRETGLPAVDVLLDGPADVIEALAEHRRPLGMDT